MSFASLKLTNRPTELKHAVEDLRRRVKVIEHWKDRSIEMENDSKTLNDNPRIVPENFGRQSSLTEIPANLNPLLVTNLTNLATNLAGNALRVVYPKLVSWLIEPAARKVGSWTKVMSASNEVRQLLFDRQRKAEEKYGEGLKFDEGPDGLYEASNKLGDAIFFLYKVLVNSYNKPLVETLTEKVEKERTLKVINDLILLLQNLASDIKKQV